MPAHLYAYYIIYYIQYIGKDVCRYRYTDLYIIFIFSVFFVTEQWGGVG